MRKKVFLIVPLLWVLCIDVCAQIVERYLTIEEMFQLTEQNNSRIKAHTMAVRQARQEVKVAKNAFLPSIEASLSLSYNGDGTILDRDFGNSINAPIPDFGNNFAIEVCTDPKKLDRLLNRFIGKEFGIAPDSFRLILV